MIAYRREEGWSVSTLSLDQSFLKSSQSQTPGGHSDFTFISFIQSTETPVKITPVYLGIPFPGGGVQREDWRAQSQSITHQGRVAGLKQ